MKKPLLITLAAVLALAVGAFFFFHTPSDAYVEAIPQDATAIVRLDLRALAADAYLTADEQQQLLRRLTSFAVASSSGASPAAVVPAPFGAGSSSPLGLDLTRPLYAFASPSGSFGLVARVADKDDLRARLADLAAAGRVSEVTSQRGLSWAVVAQQWLLAFGGTKALVMGPAVGSAQDQLRTEMVRLLEQGTKESGKNSPLYAQLRKTDAPVAAVLAPGLLPANVRDLLAPLDIRSADDALLRLTLEPDDNDLDLEATILTDNNNVRARLREADDLLRPLKADLLDYTHERAAAWMAVNVKGDDLLPLLRRNDQLRLALVAVNLVVDADLIIRSIDGDVAVEFSDLTPSALAGSSRSALSDAPLPTTQLTARLTDTDFLRHASTWGSGNVMPVRALSPNDFAITLGRQPLYFGAHDKVFYLGTMPVLAESRKDDTNVYLRDHRKSIRGCRFYASIDMQAFSASTSDALPDILHRFDRLTIEMEKAGKLELTLSAPEGTNIAKDILLSL